MTRRPSLRASDSDREQIADRLRHATAEGRLDADELDQRLGALFSARTYGELDTLVADLPVPRRDHRRRSAVSAPALGALALIALLAVLGLASRVRLHASAVGAGSANRVVHPGSGPIVLNTHPGVPAFAVAAPLILGLLITVALCAVLGWMLLRTARSAVRR